MSDSISSRNSEDNATYFAEPYLWKAEMKINDDDEMSESAENFINDDSFENSQVQVYLDFVVLAVLIKK